MENMKKRTLLSGSCLLSQNDKGCLDLETNGLKKALCGRDWIVMESLDLLDQIDYKMNLAVQH